MAALKSSKTTDAVVTPIANFGNKVSEVAGKMPTYAPIVPTPGGMMSPVALERMG